MQREYRTEGQGVGGRPHSQAPRWLNLASLTLGKAGVGEACLLLGRGPCLSQVGEATPEEAGRAWAAGSGERPAALGQARLWLCDLKQVTRLSSPAFQVCGMG